MEMEQEGRSAGVAPSSNCTFIPDELDFEPADLDWGSLNVKICNKHTNMNLKTG